MVLLSTSKHRAGFFLLETHQSEMANCASLENVTQPAKEGLALAADENSTCFRQILPVIEIIEENLRERRNRIEELQTRHEQLVIEYEQLGKSLDSETTDLAQKFAGSINDLSTDVSIVRLLLGEIPAPAGASDLASNLPGLAPIPDCDQDAQRSQTRCKKSCGPFDRHSIGFSRKRGGLQQCRHARGMPEVG